MLLVALAVAFLSGLRATAPDMKTTGTNYVESKNLADIQILSTLGLTDDDVKAIAARPEISECEGVYVIDVFAISLTTDLVTKLYSLPESDISNVTLMEGRMPERDDECLLEELALNDLNVGIGDSVILQPGGDYEDSLKCSEFKVVGTVRSPIYLAVDRGSSTIGTGATKIYAYVLKSAFDMDYYTAVFARADGTEGMTAFYDEYDDYIDGLIDSMEAFSDERAELRYASVIGEANDKIADGESQIADGKQELADAEQKLNDAKKKLDDAKKKLADGEKELADGKKELDDGWEELEDGRIKLEDGWKELAENGQKLKDSKAELEDAKVKLDDGLKEINDNKRKIDDGKYQLYIAYTQIQDGKRQIAEGRETLASSRAQLDYGWSMLPLLPAAMRAAVQSQLEAGELQYAEGLAELNAYDAEIADAQSKYSEARYELENGEKELAKAEKEYWEKYAEYEDGLKEFEDGERKYTDGLAEYAENKRKYEDGLAEYQENKQKYEDGLRELEENKQKYEDGLKEYEDGLAEFEEKKPDAETKIADGEADISDARDKLADLKDCEWYVFARDYNPGYTGLGQDADRMGNLSNVFPVIFFLVAALVCLTTMTRMVEEQRIQIGGMKALGYGPLRISVKYVGYGFIPSLVGSVIGLAIGYTVFPTMIFTAYQIMYQVPDIEIHWYRETSLICVVCAVACTTLSSLWACLSTLSDTPANLMRPKTPPAGKRVFLEYIRPLWKRMSFNGKVTARNLFRYQKRFWMTVIGIAGCCALMIAGFGLRSSLTFTMHRQYEDLFHYNAQVSISDSASDEDIDAFIEFIENDDRITGYMPSRMMSYTARTDEGNQTAYLYVLNADEVGEYVDIYDYDTGKMMSLSDDGIYIDKKLSELIGVGVGDEVFIDADDKCYATVAGIFEHYTGHFTYMTPAYYEKIFGKEWEVNGYYLQFTSNDADFCDEIFEDFMDYEAVRGTSRLADIQDTYLKSMERIDFVVVIIILCSGALALIVLYNLSNINISERLRELATIKVLGFYDGEVSAYIYRENIVLTVFGIALGIVLGHSLHTWLVKSVEIDLMMFGRETDPYAYLWSTILTVVFAFFANLMAHFKMKKIDMVESLKSAE